LGSGSISQGDDSIAIGTNTGEYNQGIESIAIGFFAGGIGQGPSSISIGSRAGEFNQGSGSIAIGFQAGITGQSVGAIAIGYEVGEVFQAPNSVIIGSFSNTLGITANNSVAVGSFNFVDAYSIALGYSINTNGNTGCIVLNSGSSFVSCQSSNQFVLAGVKTADPNASGPIPVLQQLTNPNPSASGGNIWLPVQIGTVGYLIPIFYQ
jgi:hypothetical protein